MLLHVWVFREFPEARVRGTTRVPIGEYESWMDPLGRYVSKDKDTYLWVRSYPLLKQKTVRIAPPYRADSAYILIRNFEEGPFSFHMHQWGPSGHANSSFNICEFHQEKSPIVSCGVS